MEREFLIDTAKNICTILSYNQTVVMSWGAERFRATTYKGMAALRFSVNGFLHKGTVMVAYNEGADLFEIYCLNSKGAVVNSARGVYFDELTDRLDTMIETKSNDTDYHTKIEQWLRKTE